MENDDPEGLMNDVKDYNRCEDCNIKIKPHFTKCYKCFMKNKEGD